MFTYLFLRDLPEPYDFWEYLNFFLELPIVLLMVVIDLILISVSVTAFIYMTVPEFILITLAQYVISALIYIKVKQ